MNIYITRHGETDWNTQWRLQGRTDTELNNKGLAQARQSYEAFCREGIFFDKVYSSPLKRALKTAQIMSGLSQENIVKDKRIIEFCFGDAEGKTPSEREEDPELRDFKYFFDAPDLYIARSTAESFESALERTAEFWEKEIRSLEAEKDIENVLIVTHGGTMQALLMHLDGRSLKDFWKTKMPNCTMNKVTLQNGIFNLEYTGKTFY